MNISPSVLNDVPKRGSQFGQYLFFIKDTLIKSKFVDRTSRVFLLDKVYLRISIYTRWQCILMYTIVIWSVSDDEISVKSRAISNYKHILSLFLQLCKVIQPFQSNNHHFKSMIISSQWVDNGRYNFSSVRSFERKLFQNYSIIFKIIYTT